MNIAKRIATLKTIAEDLEPCGNARLAAMILFKNKMVSIGVNQYKTHPFAAKYSKNPDAIYLHAEAAAILSAKKKLTDQQLRKSTLIICRVKNILHGRKYVQMYGTAKPCSGCEQCIKEHGIEKLIYTVECAADKLKYMTEVS